MKKDNFENKKAKDNRERINQLKYHDEIFKAAQQSAQTDRACTCAEPYRHPYNESWCTRCNGTIPQTTNANR